ncbi:DUF4232 domain-containing protein [Streptomyces roseirectus]|uniref:DUF4232 domain-containing protein n=1 Tax=Streptomyces roseirectus TaxID=2768066 RepID=A0A7H0I605_9ACTN|nr:DUF4232 domain-containing protein [Streptomyces roseirectus]QNP68221.1 DUF4232 domain-containing protein [Streptomyces roseirectus]
MNMNRKFVTAAATALLTAGAIGTAQAAPHTSTAPSACRPANHLAKIAQDQSSAGHIHFRVTLTAPRGYAPCTLAGSPTDVRFSDHGTPLAITAGRYGDQTASVTFGPGRPVHFDIQVPNFGQTVPADEASFTLRTPDGVIPGTSFAHGTFRVATGTLIGPVQPGA